MPTDVTASRDQPAGPRPGSGSAATRRSPTACRRAAIIGSSPDQSPAATWWYTSFHFSSCWKPRTVVAASMTSSSVSVIAGEVIDRLGPDRRRHHGVVRRAGHQPRLGRGRPGRQRLPHRTGDRKVRQLRCRLDDANLVGHQPESGTHIADSDDDRVGGRGGEAQPDGILATADRQRMHFQRRGCAPRCSGRPRACARPGCARARASGRRCSPP